MILERRPGDWSERAVRGMSGGLGSLPGRGSPLSEANKDVRFDVLIIEMHRYIVLPGCYTHTERKRPDFAAGQAPLGLPFLRPGL